MKRTKVFLTLLTFFAAFQFCFGQEKPKAELIDEFGKLNCEDVLARLDNFFVALRNDPSATGYIIINGKKADHRQSYKYRSMIRGHMYFRRFDPTQLTIIRGEEAENLKVQFWLAPAGTEIPSTANLSWDSPVPVSKPFIIYSEYSDGFICPSDGLIRFSEILTQKFDVRGHIVINTKSVKAFNERKKELLKEFKEIPAGRLRFFHVRHSSDTYVEYWLVPQKKLN